MYVNCATTFLDYDETLLPVFVNLECLTDTCCHGLLNNNIIYASYSFRHGALFGILQVPNRFGRMRDFAFFRGDIRDLS